MYSAESNDKIATVNITNNQEEELYIYIFLFSNTVFVRESGAISKKGRLSYILKQSILAHLINVLIL